MTNNSSQNFESGIEPRLYRYQQIAESLARHVAEKKIGTRLPSIRNIERNYEASRATVHKALTLLEDQGLICREHGRGVFVADNSRSIASALQTPVLAAVVPANYSNVISMFVECFTIAAKAVNAKPIRLQFDAIGKQSVFDIPSERIDALLLFPSAEPVSLESLAHLRSLDIPLVICDRLLKGLEVDCVSVDNEHGGRIAAEHLVKHGHRRLVVLSCEPHNSNGKDRLCGFETIAAEAGATVELIDCNTPNGADSAAAAYQGLASRLDSGSCDFTGVFVLSDRGAMGAMKLLHDRQIRIPDEVSVVGFDGIDETEFYYPALTTVNQDFSQIAREGVSILMKRLEGDDRAPLCRAVEPHLIERESSGPCRQKEKHKPSAGIKLST